MTFLEFYETALAFCEAVLEFDKTFLEFYIILDSDWLIFCCGNLILYQKKKEIKMIKPQFFDEKQQKKAEKVYVSVK